MPFTPAFHIRITDPATLHENKKKREKRWEELDKKKKEQRRRSSAHKERLAKVITDSTPPSPSGPNGTHKEIWRTPTNEQAKGGWWAKRILDKFMCWQLYDCGSNNNNEQTVVLCEPSQTEEIDQRSTAKDLPVVEGFDQSIKDSLASIEFEPQPSTSEQADLVDLSLRQGTTNSPNS
ncbi:unnamed protein product [Meganyctiphanes norvegica]|uniref:Uncharacterized protein n=1 Tax=Meganyctiphanes norvegica TaxID=48144 RepID=A0AAV2PTA2_MEGNR